MFTYCHFSPHRLRQCHLTEGYCKRLAEETQQMDLDLTGNYLKH